MRISIAPSRSKLRRKKSASFAQFRAPLQRSDWRQPADLPAKVEKLRCQTTARKRPSQHARDQRRRRISGRRLFRNIFPAAYRSFAKRIPAAIRLVEHRKSGSTKLWMIKRRSFGFGLGIEVFIAYPTCKKSNLRVVNQRPRPGNRRLWMNTCLGFPSLPAEH